ncbi:hypothetical protein B0H10DRAFT_2082913, partial [Mycena sp. CBHHK59/15]
MQIGCEDEAWRGKEGEAGASVPWQHWALDGEGARRDGRTYPSCPTPCTAST